MIAITWTHCKSHDITMGSGFSMDAKKLYDPQFGSFTQHVWLDPVFEVTYPCFPSTGSCVKDPGFPGICFNKRSRLLVTWLFGINDVTYPLSDHNRCLLWHHEAVISNILLAMMRLSTNTFTIKKQFIVSQMKINNFNGNVFIKTSQDKNKTQWVTGSWFVRSFHWISAKSLNSCCALERFSRDPIQGSHHQNPPTNWVSV